MVEREQPQEKNGDNVRCQNVTQAFLHTQTRLHTDVLTQKHFYAQTPSHAAVLTRRRADTFTHTEFLHTDVFTYGNRSKKIHPKARK